MAYWAVAQPEAHRERVAERFLKQFGYEPYLPWGRRFLIRFRPPIEYRMPYFPGYAFVRIELQWHKVKECPGVLRLVRIGSDEPVHDGAIDLSNENRGRKKPQDRRPGADRFRALHRPFRTIHPGVATAGRRPSSAQRQVRLLRDAVELI
jgi:transcription antitermination factor NusG